MTCLDGLSLALSQISFTITELSKRNYKNNVTELKQLVQQYGIEAERHLFRCLLSYIDFNSDKSVNKDTPQVQLFLEECEELVRKPHFASILCYALDKPESFQKSVKPSLPFLYQFSKILKISKVQEVVFGIGVQSSSLPDFRSAGETFVRQKLPELIRSYIDADDASPGLADVAIEVLHLLLTYIKKKEESSLVPEDQLHKFVASLQKDFPRERVPLVLAPLLYPYEPRKDPSPCPALTDNATAMLRAGMEAGHLADQMEEIGYACTSTQEMCRETLRNHGVQNLSPACVARVIGMMCRTLTSLDGAGPLQALVQGGRSEQSGTTWNPDLLVDVLKELTSNLNWPQVMQELDYPGFTIKEATGMKMIVLMYQRATNSQFPIHVVYKPWKNTAGQFSWVECALRNPDVFCFGDYPFHHVNLDVLKAPPDESRREIKTWKSLDLVELLLHFSEAGSTFEGMSYESVLACFSWPIQNCPDILTMTIMQVQSNWKQARNDVLLVLMPVFLNNHPNSLSILHYAWHGQGQSTAVRQLIMQGMGEWYAKAEKLGDQIEQQTRLSRILDIAQDLKALSMLLNLSTFGFVIDLAALASRREYLKLDKWLNDKLREHQEKFGKELVAFLKRRCPQLVGVNNLEQPKAVQLTADTIATAVTCLQMNSSMFNVELQDLIKTMLANHVPLMKSRQPVGNIGPNPPGGGGGGHMMPPGAKRDSAAFGGSPIGGMRPDMSTPPLGGTSDPLSQFGLSSVFNSPGNGSSGNGFPSSTVAPGNGNNSGNNSLGNSFNNGNNSSAIGGAIGGGPFGTGAAGGLSSLGGSGNSMQAIGSSKSAATGGGQFGSLLSGSGGAGGGGLGSNSLSQNNPLISQYNTSPGGGLGAGAADAFAAVGSGGRRGNNSLAGGSLGSSSFSAFSQQTSSLAQQQSRQNETRLKQAAAAGDISAVVPGMDQDFSKEVDDEANSYFKLIYNRPPNPCMTIDEVLDMLKRFNKSQDKKENDVFLCMLRNLFEEYRFFPQYPEKELHITACLFGGIIEQGLITYMALGIALRYVMEALRKPTASNMYMFGTTALDKFKTRLKDYPHYCNHLASIPHFKDFPPHLIEFIRYGQQSQEPPSGAVRNTAQTNSPSFIPGLMSQHGGMSLGASQTDSPTPPPLGPPSTPNTKTTVTATSTGGNASNAAAVPTSSAVVGGGKKEPSIVNTTNIDTLLDASRVEMKQPSESVQDKVHFIFNNISATNFNGKADELKAVISAPEWFPWMAQYLVMKRVSIEPNFHQLYTDFLKALSLPELTQSVLTETYRNIKVLLRSDKGPSNFSDRSLLKNLGHWLGMQTLGSNRPILYRDIEVKSMLIEAYMTGQQELLYVVPFIAKILESCAKSRVFKSPNPWLMGVLSVMVELHSLANLKLNLKFEVEVLCNTLGIDLKDVKVSEQLKDPEILNKIEPQLAPPEKEKGSSSSETSAKGPPVPMFSYHDISIGALAWLGPHIRVDQNLVLFQQAPHLKQAIRPAIERSVQELLFPVVERTNKLCLTTAEMIVKKDFALDPEESRMRTAAHHMVRNVTAGIAMITCREPLLVSLNTNIKQGFVNIRGASPQQKELLEQAAQQIAQDNLELCCAFIQKTAVEKALYETDKRLANEYELRKQARTENRRYCDPLVLTYQAERMPEQIRLKVGGVTSSQMTVYEEFARSIPGFLPPQPGQITVDPFPKPPAQQQDQASTLLPQAEMHIGDTHKSYMPDDVVHILGKCAAEIEQHIHHMEQQVPTLMVNPAAAHISQLHGLLDMVVNARVTRDNLSSLRLIRKAVEGVLETQLPNDSEMMLRYKDCHLIVLRGFQDPRGYGPLWTARQVLKVLADMPPESRFNFEGVDILIRAHLITMREFDLLLAQWMDAGHQQALALAVQLCRAYLIEEKHRTIVTESELGATLETLSRVYSNRQNPSDGLASLLETHASSGSSSSAAPGSSSGLFNRQNYESSSSEQKSRSVAYPNASHEFEDVSGLREKVECLLREWVRLYHHQSAGRSSEKAFQAFVPQLHQYGILKTDDLITRFFKYCTEICVDFTYRALSDYSQSPTMARTKCLPTIDAYCRLIALLVKHSGDNANSVTKINLLNRVLSIIGNVLQKDHEFRQTEFHQLAYHRMFEMLVLELNAPEPVLEAINFQILSCFANVLHELRPSRCPGFAFSWLELVSHRTLMSKLLLNSPQQKGWVPYHQLLIDLFQFLAPFLRNVELAKQTYLLYKGTLRVLLVLLHDFPEFLCDYHFSFCDVIPPNCIQMRSLILSAFPRNMRLPDPFTPNLKVDLLSDITHPPRILTNFSQAIQPATFKRDLDSYLKTRAPVTFLSELRSHLQTVNEPGTRYNVPLMNALVLYVGTQAIAYIQTKSGAPSLSTITHSSHMDIFQNLAVDLDTEGRYLYLNAIANQLRYPNSHTHYFSCTLLYLFAEANSEAIQEQITRVLLERLIVNRPHPWGLLITFIELIKNHNYKFWDHDFVHCAPEIEKLFDSVARSCNNPQQPSSRNGSENGD